MIARQRGPEGPAWHLGCLALLLTFVGFPVVGEISFHVAYQIVERPILNSIYGPGSYANGLRVVGKHGELSDGRQLPRGYNIVLGIGTFILMLPIVVAYFGILKLLGMFPPDRMFKRQ
jgi:hypothetical protein